MTNLTTKVQECFHLGCGESPRGPDCIEREPFAGPVWKEFTESAAEMIPFPSIWVAIVP